jgi:hypothetical protein
MIDNTPTIMACKLYSIRRTGRSKGSTLDQNLRRYRLDGRRNFGMMEKPEPDPVNPCLADNIHAELYL